MAAYTPTPTNVKIKPMSVTWGVDTAQVVTVTLPADSSSSLNNKYFYIYSGAGVKYYVWFNVGSAGSDPAPGGATGEVVAIAANSTANQVASAVQSVLNGMTGIFSATVSSATVTVTNTVVGFADGPHDGPSGSKTGATFAVTTQGISAADVGIIDGNIEFPTNVDLEPITAHQTGTSVLGHIRKGMGAPKMTITFKEASTAQLKKVIAQDGTAFVPGGAGATEVYGMGTGKLFTNTFAQATQIILHPVNLPSTDHSQDITIHKGSLHIAKLTFSGDKIFNLPCEIFMYQDTTKQPGVDYYVIGDSTQSLS